MPEHAQHVDAMTEPNALLPGRQAQVLHLLADGFTTAQIARQLQYSEGTIKKLVRAAIEETGARNRVQAVAIAIRRDLI